MKKALITWITWQDWAYLAQLLLDKWYEVHGLKRRNSLLNTDRIDHLYQEPHNPNRKFFLHYGDLTDSTNLIKLIWVIKPDEVYNLAAQSHVHVSFEIPEYTANADWIGTLRILEAIRINNLEKQTKFYQASTSELFGWLDYNRPEAWYTEESPMHPRSPYWVAKLYAMWITRNYKESYDMFACNWILFNHESPLRWETFVTRKITRAVAQIHLWMQDKLYLGNLDAKRDWWHAKDFVEAMWMILQQDKPDDYVIATWVANTVRQFVEWSFEEAWITVEWKWEWIDEKGYDKATWKCIVEVDPKYFRPAEVEFLLWDPTKAKKVLWWTPSYTVRDMCKEMVKCDVDAFRKKKILKDHWYEILNQYE
ncbi:MAG: GDP-D-mannose dehydratase [uncultured bacterium (gcode 4)]|uniref:GDP-mannose 4,6-dehydratase n=1 Tax=uncultured bacterium (gcode 4) TaxID=1234023 RepID=K2G4R9_9BACT|nr:MAG: GDP-D-mannose dehydratase [uncultured bacterium (gcode 4)]